MGIHMVDVMRENHFSHERRIIMFYSAIYFVWLSSDLGLIIYGMTLTAKPDTFIRFNSYVWAYVNMTTSGGMIV